jgi:hypothetical protein
MPPGHTAWRPQGARPLLQPLASAGSQDEVTCTTARYPAGHACDHVPRWSRAMQPFASRYRFGCEPYATHPFPTLAPAPPP